MENNRLQKTSAVMDRIFKIAQGFLIAVAVVCAIFIPLVLILGEKMVAGASSLDLGSVKLDLVGDGMQLVNVSTLKPVIACELGLYILAFGVGWYLLRVLRQILAPMKEGRPFESGVSGKIAKLGWTALIGGAIVELAAKVIPYLDAKCYDLARIFNSEAVEGVSFNFRFFWWVVPVALVLFFLSYVFKYGEALQKESDETL